MRPSIKACVWLGAPDCYRDMKAVLWTESDRNRAMRLSGRCNNDLQRRPSGHSTREKKAREAAEKNGGVTPFNLLPIPHADSTNGAGAHGHGAGTPLDLAEWWTRYITRPGDVVCDPLMGSGTMGIAALKLDRSFLGIEKYEPYFRISERRIAREAEQAKLFV